MKPIYYEEPYTAILASLESLAKYRNAKQINTWWTNADNIRPESEVTMPAVPGWDRFGGQGDLPWGEGDPL